MTNRYEILFEKLKKSKQAAFIPYFCLGNPTVEISLEIIDAAMTNGADALEVGFAFSDPVADGVVLQNANTAARAAGANVNVCFEMLKQIRTKYPNVPIGLLLYANIIYAMGIDKFYKKCRQVKVDSVLIADVPLGEIMPFKEASIKHEIDQVLIVPPNANNLKIEKIAAVVRGYTYVQARDGVTGIDGKGKKIILKKTNIQKNICSKLIDLNAVPPIVGFGISTKSDVLRAIKNGALGVIVGSAIAKIIEDNMSKKLANKNNMLKEIGRYIASLKAKTKL